MGNAKTTIELNGKKYDARTGKIIEDNTAHVVQPSSVPAPKVVDGFIKPKASSAQATSQPNIKVQSVAAKATTSRTTGVNHNKRAVSKSKTLMRPAVKKPVIKNDVQRVRYVTQPSHAEVARVTRAKSAQKSPLISKFGHVGLANSVKKSVEHLPLANPPLSVASVSHAVENELEKFEKSIKTATSHMQQLEKDVVKKVPFLKRVGFKNRPANLATASLAVLLLVGFFGYQNSAYISMKVASSQAGISAKIPTYTPAGYSVGRGVEASDGKIRLSFISNTDSKSYTLTQQASNWNSSSLLANSVQQHSCSTCYQTWQEDGKTVYIYDESNATWVDGGIWYTVEGNAFLTSDQLLRIASSF